jgi:hypothetical protein
MTIAKRGAKRGLLIAMAFVVGLGAMPALAETIGPPPAGKGRIVLFRASSWAGTLARGWPVKVDGQDAGNLKAGTFVIADRAPGNHTLSMEQWDEPGVSKRSVHVAAGQTTFFRLEMRDKAKKAMMVGGLVGGGLLGYAVAASIAKKENPTGLYEFVSVSDGRKATAEMKKAGN